MRTLKYFLTLALIAVSLVSCKEKSLQKYLVEKQDDTAFMKMDIAPSMLEGVNSNFTPEEKEVLHTIKKINIVAYGIADGDTLQFNREQKELKDILDQDRYKELTRIKSNDWNATLKYTGSEDAINEVIVFASDKKKGFAVFRMLGENMRPDEMLMLLKSSDKGDLDFSKFEGLGKIFKD